MLSESHKKELEIESGISPGVIAQRGYRTVTDAKELAQLGFAPDQCKTVPGLLIPIHGLDGDVVLHQFKGSNPRIIDGKPIKYETPAKAPMRLDVPVAIAKELMDPSIPLCITEGMKKVDALITRGACTVGLLGVWNFSGTNQHGGIQELQEWSSIPLKHKDGTARVVYIIFDSDIVDKSGVKLAAIRLAAVLRRRGATVRMIRIPSGDEKVGVDDYFSHGGTLQELLAAEDPSLLRLDMIRVDGRGLADLTDDAIQALVRYNDPPKLFVRGGELVTVQTDERDHSRIMNLSTDQVRGILSRATGWYRMTAKGSTSEIFCPSEVATDVRTQLSWPGIPPLTCIAKSPVLSGDKLERGPGYVPNAAVFLDCPAVEEFRGTGIQAAAWLKDEVFGEFPFQGDADWAHTLCLCLLPILRPAIDGPTPLHLFGAPTPGSGKTLLARVCLMLTQGANIAMTTMSGNEEETRKRITSSLLDGSPYLFFDNLVGRVRSESLSTILTNNVWSDRRLGGSTNVQIEVTQALVATANNPDMDRDIVRRSVRIWIDPRVERPEMRGGFRPVERIIREKRPALIGALCRIVDSWVTAGRPSFQGRPMGSFEAWCDIMGGVLAISGVKGFLGNVHEMHQHDALEAAWQSFYTRWSLEPGDKRISDIIHMFEVDDDLSGLLGDRGDISRKTRLASVLRGRMGVVCSEHIIELAPRKDHGSAMYRLVHVSERDKVARLFEPEEPKPVRTEAQMQIFEVE